MSDLTEKKVAVKKIKTTVLLNSALWKSFKLEVLKREDISQQSEALEFCISRWLESLGTPQEQRDQTKPPPLQAERDSTGTSGLENLHSDSLASNHGRAYEQLNTILGSGVAQIIDAITSNLNAFEAFALLVGKTGATGAKTVRTGKQDKDTAAELDRANQAAIRSRAQLNASKQGNRKRKEGPGGEAKSA